MRHIIKLFVIVLSLGMVLGGGMVYAIPIELLPNGTFSTGDLTGWTASGIHPVTVINTSDGYSGPRPGAADNYFVRGGDVLGSGDSQPTGAARLTSDPFTIPLDATSTEVDFWWRFVTWDSKDYDYGWAVVRKDNPDTFVDRPCGRIGGGDAGGLEDSGWMNCTKTYDTLTLAPGVDYYLRFVLLTTLDTLNPSWGYVDDVSVAADVPRPVTEPSTLLLLGVALVGMPLIARKINRRARK